MTDSLRRPVDVKQAAMITGVSPATIRWWISQGLVTSVLSDGKRWMAELDVLVCDREQRQKAKARKGGNRRRATP